MPGLVLLLGLFVSLFARGDGSTFSLVALGLMYGAAFGIVFGLLSYASLAVSVTSCRAVRSLLRITTCTATPR